jgi:hypothetical protein
MSDGFMVITEKDWEHATSEQRDWMVFNTMQSVNQRLGSLERRDLYYKICAFGGGMVGGALVIGGMKILGG